MEKREYFDLGSFEMTGEVMRVSDPCYDKDVWCCGTVQNCKTGEWVGVIRKHDEGDWGKRVGLVAAVHESSKVTHLTLDQFECVPELDDEGEETGMCTMYSPKGWEHCGFEVGVDSGQAGLFDDLLYDKDEQFVNFHGPKSDYGSVFYNYCCGQTLGEMSAGVIPNGVVSSSGYGDGSYDAFYHCGADGKVDAVVIIFL